MTEENIDYSKFLCKTSLSPIDERDWIAEQIHPNSNEIKLPIVLDYRFDQLPIRNQGEQGSCAAHAACVMKEWQELKNINLNEYMSPQFIYNNRKNQDSEGMYGRDLMKILQKKGSVEENKYKYGKIEKPETIPTSIYNRAQNHRIKGYARVETIEGLKVALKKNGPCYISFPVYNYGKEFWHPKSEDELWWGGHAVAVVAYDTSGFWLKNSWGTKWNGNGYTRYPFEHWGEHWEIFTTIDDISSIIFDDEKLEEEERKRLEEEERKRLEEEERKRLKEEEEERKRLEEEERKRLEEEEEERKRLEEEEEERKRLEEEEEKRKRLEEEEEEEERKRLEEEERKRLEEEEEEEEERKRLEEEERKRLEEEEEEEEERKRLEEEKKNKKQKDKESKCFPFCCKYPKFKWKFKFK